MTQPPSQQPPQGGFGAPQDPQQGAPQQPAVPPQAPAQPPQTPPQPAQAPAQPAVPPQAPPQPPQAPAQPPQAPPTGQPGYAYPPAPPAGEPGYGYPPQAPGPYGQQPGPYGQQPGPYAGQPGQPAQPGAYPHQPGQPGPYPGQPGPYAAQAGPYGPGPQQGGYPPQQGGYPPQQGGYPPQQFPGAPFAFADGSGNGGNGGQKPKNKVAIIAAAAVAGLVIVGVGAWAVVGNGGDDGDKPVVSKSSGSPDVSGSPSPGVDEGDGSGTGREANDDLNAGRKAGEAKVDWMLINDVQLPRNGAEVFGPWFAGDTVVKAMYKEVVGYSVADGKKQWTVPLAAPVCATPTAPTADGKMVVAIMDGNTEKSNCTQLQMVDLNTGKAGWKKTVEKGGLFDFIGDPTLAITGNTVTVGRTSYANAYRVSDGKDLFATPTTDCKPYSFASGGGPRMIAAATCRTGDTKALQELDPTTGAAKWSFKLTKGYEVDKVYSVDPLVVSMKDRDKKTWSIVSFNANGTQRAVMKGSDDKFSVNCGGGIIFDDTIEGCVGVATDATHFYMSTSVDYGKANEVVAYSLATGAITSRTKAPDGRTMTLMGTEGGKPLVYITPTYEKGGAVATIASGGGGSPKILLQNPDSTATIENSFSYSKFTYVDGRFYLLADRVSGTRAELLKKKTMIVYGK
ncbi:PQQ-binding-like beta-propeller repeat protein [Streptomyces sp. NPDC093109]|uniref:outer membrane protein assembly factor BamB family protein n=1 Tax=Streptomyces sp. NPDC093109 TaxID=3154977 RepID=UPI00344C581E